MAAVLKPTFRQQVKRLVRARSCDVTLMLVDWSFWKKYLWKDSGTLSSAMTASQRQAVCCATRQKKKRVNCQPWLYGFCVPGKAELRVNKFINCEKNLCLHEVNVCCQGRFEFRAAKLKYLHYVPLRTTQKYTEVLTHQFRLDMKITSHQNCCNLFSPSPKVKPDDEAAFQTVWGQKIWAPGLRC